VSSNDYRFETNWRVHATPEQVTEILSDAPGLARWWRQVYLEVQESEPGVYSLLTKGWLPYRLHWSFRVTDRRTPYGFSIEAWGDLEGSGVWTFTRDGEWTNIHYDWRVKAEKPVLRYLSFVLKPLFEANHRWAMARGEESLVRELRRLAANEREFLSAFIRVHLRPRMSLRGAHRF
jgi:hypothetical protein